MKLLSFFFKALFKSASEASGEASNKSYNFVSPTIIDWNFKTVYNLVNKWFIPGKQNLTLSTYIHSLKSRMLYHRNQVRDDFIDLQ
jgi:hypothetical protein